MVMSRKELLTRRAELGFIVLMLMFSIGMLYFLAPTLHSGHHREQLTSTFFVFLSLAAFCGLVLVISAWLFLLSIGEAEEINRKADELRISYVHLGQHVLKVPGAGMRMIGVRLFRLDSDKGYEPAWLLLLGGLRLATIPRLRADHLSGMVDQ
jgi:hypothetical protein